MINHTLKTQPTKKQTLLYANKKNETMTFKKEIQKIKNPNFKHHLFITQQKKSTRINAQTIKKHIQKPENKTFFICGKPESVKKIKKELKKLNIKEKNIKTEEFLRPTKITYYS